MLTIILEDKVIHQGLFPGPGTIQADGTSNKHPKSEFEWTVAVRLFSDDATYGNSFAESQNSPKGRTQWLLKVKNRLKQFRARLPSVSCTTLTPCFRMQSIVAECSDYMGETGQGCKSEKDVEETGNPNLIRRWCKTVPGPSQRISS